MCFIKSPLWCIPSVHECNCPICLRIVFVPCTSLLTVVFSVFWLCYLPHFRSSFINHSVWSVRPQGCHVKFFYSPCGVLYNVSFCSWDASLEGVQSWGKCWYTASISSSFPLKALIRFSFLFSACLSLLSSVLVFALFSACGAPTRPNYDPASFLGYITLKLLIPQILIHPEHHDMPVSAYLNRKKGLHAIKHALRNVNTSSAFEVCATLRNF